MSGFLKSNRLAINVFVGSRWDSVVILMRDIVSSPFFYLQLSMSQCSTWVPYCIKIYLIHTQPQHNKYTINKAVGKKAHSERIHTALSRLQIRGIFLTLWTILLTRNITFVFSKNEYKHIWKHITLCNQNV